MDDNQVHESIERLVAEEHELWKLEGEGRATNADRQRLQEVKVALDRYWDLLRQRRAHEEFGLNPNDTEERSANVVENYQQ